jgi:hypothetical protein
MRRWALKLSTHVSCALLALAVMGTLAATPAAAAPAVRCESVSYTFPGTHDEGHAALNNITASGVSCVTARTVAKAFLVDNKPPAGWRATSKTVVSHGNTLGEEIFSRGSARVAGDIAN